MPDIRPYWRATPPRYLPSVLIAASLLIALIGCGHPLPDYVSKYTPPRPEPRPIAIAIVDNPYTDGASVGTLAWPALVTAQLLKQNINVDLRTAAGSSPDRDGQALTKEIKHAVQPTTKLVVLFGSRDDMKSPIADVSTSIKHALADAKGLAPNTRILVIGPSWTDGPPPQPLLAVRDTFKTSAATVGATFIDPIADGWFAGQPDLIAPDHKTLTDAGHGYLAGKVAPLIAQQLQPFLTSTTATPR